MASAKWFPFVDDTLSKSNPGFNKGISCPIGKSFSKTF